MQVHSQGIAHGLLLGALLGFPSAASAEQSAATRRIEEIVVTAEKRESTVSDTSLSITAFDSQMIEELGMQNADDLVDFLPATTRDDYDIRIRGVGRNFRALGGDPGVATYYNGVYSPDFGIAATENALYDLARIEVLRGPQGTLYGRNSIGGALNYVTNRPTMEFEGELRAQFGKYGTQEYYGFISGPILPDRLAARLVANQRDRDGHQKGLAGAPDTDSIDDRNVSLALLWQVTDDIEWNVRVNDRKSDRIIGNPVLLDLGPGPDRSNPSVDRPVTGLRCNPDVAPGYCQPGAPPTDAGTPGAMAFFNPLTGATVWGAYNRPGIDTIGWPGQPNSFYRQDPSLRPLGLSRSHPRDETQVNEDPHCDEFPYTDCNSNNEHFDHSSVQSDFTWDFTDSVSLKYIYGYTDFDYTFNTDLDNTNATFTAYRQTVDENVFNQSHELQLNWAIGERFSATSGLYYFEERRNQDYSLSNTTPRYTEATDYGGLAVQVPWLDPGAVPTSVLDLFCGPSIQERGSCSHVRLWSASPGTSNYGLWEGDPRGDIYHHQNTLRNRSTAAYTQGTYHFSDQWALVLGVRYAKDRKKAKEVRGGWYYDLLPWSSPFIGFLPGGGFILPGTLGMTQLASVNAVMGAATVTYDPANPIIPTCATAEDPSGLTDAACATPLQLAGMPMSYSTNVQGQDSWSDTNFRINVDWTPTEDILIYASLTTGYRAGGYQLGVTDARETARDPVTGLPVPGAGIVPLTYGKETIEALEIGYKGTHFDGTLQLNLSIYQYTYADYQDRVNVYDPVREEAVDIVQNANAATNRGFEAESFWLATERLSIGGSYSYTDAFYDESYFVIENDDPDLPPSLFGTVEINPDLFSKNVDKDQLKMIPKHKATIWASYEIPTDMGNFNLHADYSYTGKMYNSNLTTSLHEIPERHRVNVAVTWEDPQRHWTIRGFVDNVTNEKNLRDISPAGESGDWVLTGAILYPQYWGIDMTYRFGG